MTVARWQRLLPVLVLMPSLAMAGCPFSAMWQQLGGASAGDALFHEPAAVASRRLLHQVWPKRAIPTCWQALPPNLQSARVHPGQRLPRSVVRLSRRSHRQPDRLALTQRIIRRATTRPPSCARAAALGSAKLPSLALPIPLADGCCQPCDNFAPAQNAVYPHPYSTPQDSNSAHIPAPHVPIPPLHTYIHHPCLHEQSRRPAYKHTESAFTLTTHNRVTSRLSRRLMWRQSRKT
jgi:hypothetical protein